MSDYVKARWIGYPAQSPVFGELIPGQTVCEITATEAKVSDHWEPLTPKQQKAIEAPTPTDSTEE